MGGKEEGRRKEIETKYGDEEKGKIHNNNDTKFQNRQLLNMREFNFSNNITFTDAEWICLCPNIAELVNSILCL